MATNYRGAIRSALIQYNPNLPFDVADALAVNGFFSQASFPNRVADALSVNGFFAPPSFPNNTMLLVGYERDTSILDPNTNLPKSQGTKCQ